MILPNISDPPRLRGLYVYDFGEWTAVGYTADEIAVLLDHECYRGGKIFRIERASPDGYMELRGVSAERFQLESGMFFYRSELALARQDYAALRDAGQTSPPPCRAFLHLADRSPIADPRRYLTALIFPAEYESDIGDWLTAIEFNGGDLAEGGISHVANYYGEEKTLLERHQLCSRNTILSRSPDEVLASVRQAVQR